MFKWFRRNKGEAGNALPDASQSSTEAPALGGDLQLDRVAADPGQELAPAVPVALEPAFEASAATGPVPDAGMAGEARPDAGQMPFSGDGVTGNGASSSAQPPAAEVFLPVPAVQQAETGMVGEQASVVHGFEAPAAVETSEAPDPARPRSLRERLAATTRALSQGLGKLFKRNPKLDEALLEELETALIQADMGVATSTALVEDLRVRMRKREFADAAAMFAALRTALRALLEPHARPLEIRRGPRPFVILTVGVNGAGKTTTIGKLAKRYRQAGLNVMLAAGDTFRAAAVEQLKTWGERNQVPVIAQGAGADSASVIFDALQAATARGVDLLIADTAGRLHTQGHLMQELAKVKRVLAKIDPDAPHETLLVVDGGTGQNALNQARQFHQAVGLSGVVVTKLDGTAKGGMVFSLCRELGLPLRFIGVGEKREDLREFSPAEFVDALLPESLG